MTSFIRCPDCDADEIFETDERTEDGWMVYKCHRCGARFLI